MQACERLLWFPLILSGDLECLLLSLCYGGSISTLNTHSIFAILLVNRLLRSDALAPIASACRWAIHLPPYSVSSYVVELRRNRSPAPILLMHCLFRSLLLVTVDCERIDRQVNQHNVGLGHLTLKVILINELKLLLGLASKSLEVESSSLSVAACVGPGTLCTQGLTRTLTGSMIFRLVQQAAPSA